MSEKLKPCPFCGSKPVEDVFSSAIPNETLWTIRCPMCSAEMSISKVGYHAGMSNDKLVTAWNQRVEKE